MKRYKCKKALVLDCCDDDGFLIENKQHVVMVGDIYEYDEENQEPLITAAKPAVHLERRRKKSYDYIEIYPETLAEHFEELLEVSGDET